MDKIVLIEYADMKEEIKDLQHRITDGRKELDKLNEMGIAPFVFQTSGSTLSVTLNIDSLKLK